MSSLTGKQILVTGGCGSIGSEIVRQCLAEDPDAIRVFDNDETDLARLRRTLGDDDRLRLLLGNVRDKRRLEMAIEDIDVVFHAAALKHVEINEYNPFEAVQTNVQGTQNLIRAALDHEVDSFIGISTDKASNPTSVMGATKLVAERLITAANTYKGGRDTKFGCVRFGNVLGSNGSVVPIFCDQIRDGGPITVTDPEMTRFIMSCERAANFVLDARTNMDGGEVFVQKMPAFQLQTLAEVMKNRYAPTVGQNAADIDIDIVGRRPGERKHEKLVSTDEMLYTEEQEDWYVLYPQINVPGYVDPQQIERSAEAKEYTSADAELLDEDELFDLLKSTDTLKQTNE